MRGLDNNPDIRLNSLDHRVDTLDHHPVIEPFEWPAQEAGSPHLQQKSPEFRRGFFVRF